MPYLSVDLQMIFPAEKPHDVQSEHGDDDSKASRRPVKARCHTRNRQLSRSQLSSQTLIRCLERSRVKVDGLLGVHVGWDVLRRM